MGIYHTFRPRGNAMRSRENVPARLSFGLSGQYQLTEIKVVPLIASQTNHNVLPVWHLVSDSYSDPVSLFFYGQSIPGMRPAIAGERPEPLEPNVTYRLFVTAGTLKGQHDFQIGGGQPATK